MPKRIYQKLTASEARIPPKIFDRVTQKGDRVEILHRSGERIFMIPAEDMRLLEQYKPKRRGNRKPSR